MQTLKNIILTCVFAFCVYAVLVSYLVAMFNGSLPMMRNNEPARVCAAFPDGNSYGRDSVKSIEKYSKKTRQSFEYKDC